jgi:S-DNA-T family DNA segregation ATPase FtsK/SpoIIIE
LREFPKRRAAEALGLVLLASVAGLCVALLTWSVGDPSLNHATSGRIHNLAGWPGAIASDIAMQFLGLSCIAALTPPGFWGWRLLTTRRLARPRAKLGAWLIGILSSAALASLLPAPASWPLPTGLGGVVGDIALWAPRHVAPNSPLATMALALALAATTILALTAACGVGFARDPGEDEDSPARTKAAKARADKRIDAE